MNYLSHDLWLVPKCWHGIETHAHCWQQDQGDWHQWDVSCQMRLVRLLKCVPQNLLIRGKFTGAKVFHLILAGFLIGLLLLNSLTDKLFSDKNYVICEQVVDGLLTLQHICSHSTAPSIWDPPPSTPDPRHNPEHKDRPLCEDDQFGRNWGCSWRYQDVYTSCVHRKNILF